MPKIKVSEEYGSADVLLENVRLSFPHLWEPTSFDGDPAKAKYEASFLIEKDSENAKVLKEAVEAAVKHKMKGKKPPPDKICVKDASNYDYDGYEDNMVVLKANSKEKVNVVDRDPSRRLDAEDGKPYAGCYVNASVRVWGQNNAYGKRVNCILRSVQFARDGDPFGGGSGEAPESVFDDLSDGGGDEEDFL